MIICHQHLHKTIYCKQPVNFIWNETKIKNDVRSHNQWAQVTQQIKKSTRRDKKEPNQNASTPTHWRLRTVTVHLIMSVWFTDRFTDWPIDWFSDWWWVSSFTSFIWTYTQNMCTESSAYSCRCEKRGACCSLVFCQWFHLCTKQRGRKLWD